MKEVFSLAVRLVENRQNAFIEYERGLRAQLDKKGMKNALGNDFASPHGVRDLQMDAQYGTSSNGIDVVVAKLRDFIRYIAKC